MSGRYFSCTAARRGLPDREPDKEPDELDKETSLPGAKITALGCYVPPRVLTNQDLEKMVDTSNDWILERTGIVERHIADPNMATSDMAVEAAKAALAQRSEEHTSELQSH